MKGSYPVSKFLLLCVIAAGEQKRGSIAKRPEIAVFVRDRWMLKQLKLIHPSWFS